MTRSVIVVLILALTAASVFAIWPVVADAPWEGASRPLPTTEKDEPLSTKLAIEDSVREVLRGCYGFAEPRTSPSANDYVAGMDSEYLGEGVWEVRVDLNLESSLAATFRVRDRGSNAVREFNAVARELCQQ